MCFQQFKVGQNVTIEGFFYRDKFIKTKERLDLKLRIIVNFFD